MLRQASTRNQRSKGFKIKHALQICLLVAICVWLLYQVKHSHEKKRAFEERNFKMSRVDDSQADFFKFGRKDLPQIGEAVSVNETHNNGEENEETQEEEEQDTKQEEIDEEEGESAGDDEIDEQDQDKGDEEAEHGEESTEEDDKDIHEEGKDGHEEVDVFGNQEHEGGTQEAREENYKRDDASSAVVHDPHVTESETSTGGAENTDEEHVIGNADDDSSDNGSTGVNDTNSDGSKVEVVGENVNRKIVESDSSVNGSAGVSDTNSDGSKGEVAGENLERKIVESENVTNMSGEGSKGDNDLSDVSGGASMGDVSDTIQTDNISSNEMAADNKDTEVDNKDVEIEFSKPDNESVSNSTTVETNSQMEQQTNLMSAAGSNTRVELQINSTGGISDIPPEVQNNSTPVANDTASLDFAQNQTVAADNATVGEDALTSQNVVEQSEDSDTNDVLDSEEHPTVSTSEGESDESSHHAITEEEKDARTDLSTLLEIQNEVKTSDDEAGE